MSKEIESTQSPARTTANESQPDGELAEEQLDEVSGGIIIVGGMPSTVQTRAASVAYAPLTEFMRRGF